MSFTTFFKRFKAVSAIALVALCATLLVPSIALAESTMGSISGRVVDSDGNGIARVFVTASRPDVDPPGPAAAESIGDETDSEGYYNIVDVPDGSWTVSFEDIDPYWGEPIRPLKRYMYEYYDDAATAEWATPVVIIAASHMQDINATLAPLERVRGFVLAQGEGPTYVGSFGAVAYRYVSPGDEEPGHWEWVTGADVSAGPDLVPASVGDTSTLEQGEFEVWLPQGAYRIEGADWERDYLPGYWATGGTVADIDDASDIEIDGVEDVELQPQIILTKGGSISGRVINSRDAGIKGVSVSAYMGDDDDYISVGANTDENGYYTVKPLPAGSYTVYYDDYGDSSRPNERYVAEYAGDTKDPEASTPIDVTLGADTSDVSATLEGAGRIRGAVLDDTDQPITSGWARQYYQDGTDWYWNSSVDVASEDGAEEGSLKSGGFEFWAAPGTYRFEAGDRSFLHRSEFWTTTGGTAAITDAESSSIAEFELGVLPVPFSLSSASTISGTVRDMEGLPITEGMNVQAFRFAPGEADEDENPSLLQNVTGNENGYVTTNESGEYLLPLTVDDTVCVLFDGENYSRIWYLDSKGFAGAIPFKLASGEATTSIDQTMSPAGTISGKVIDTSGKALSNVTVRATNRTDRGDSPVFETYTEPDGTYVVEGADYGDYTVAFSDYDRRYVSQWYNAKTSASAANTVTVGLTSPNVTGVNAKMVPTGRITGVIRDKATGKPIENAYVSWQAFDSKSEYFDYDGTATMTDATGRYTLYGTGSGHAMLTASADGYVQAYFGGSSSWEGNVLFPTTSSGSVYDVSVSLVKAASVEGTLSAGGKPGGVGEVGAYRVVGNEMEWMGGTEADEDGAYRIGGLPAGTYIFEYSSYSSGYVRQWYGGASYADATKVTLATGQKLTGISVDLPAAGKITGNVFGPWATGVGALVEYDITIAAVNLDNDMVYQTSDIEGTAGDYRFTGLPAGDYKVAFAAHSDGVVEPSAQAALDLASVYYGATNDFAEAATVTVAAGATRSGIDAGLGIHGVELSGSVKNASGDPVSNAWVYLRSAVDTRVSPVFDRQIQTDGSGQYSFTSVKPGDYYLSVNPAEYAWWEPETYAYYNYNGGSGALSGAYATTLTVEAGFIPDALRAAEATSVVDVTLQNKASLTFDTKGVGGRGVGPYRSMITLYGKVAGAFKFVDWRYASGTTGRTTFGTLVPGEYKVEFKDQRGAYKTAYFKTSTTNGATLADGVPIALTAGQSKSATMTLSHLGYSKTLLRMPASTYAPSYGGYASLYAQVSDINGWGLPYKYVKIYSGPTSRGPWTYRTTRKVNSYGLASAYSVKPSVLTYYRGVYADPAGKTKSVVMYVKPKAYVSLSAPTTAKRYVAFGVSGYLKPKHSSGSSAIKVVVQKLSGESYVTVKTVTMKVGNYSSYSKFTGKITVTSAGKYRLSSTHSDGGHSLSTSSYRYVTVK